MRLDIEQAKKYLQGMHRLWLCDEWGQPYNSEQCKNCDSDDNCLDIVLSSESMSDIAQDLYDTFQALQQEIERLKATIDEIKGIVGYPGEEALKKHGLTDTLPNIVRYLHREWLEQTHRAGQRCIEKDIEIDRLKDENEQLRAQVAVYSEALKQISEVGQHGCENFNGTDEHGYPCRCFACWIREIADKAISTDAVQDYHNPADVEALRNAREALYNLRYTLNYFRNESSLVPRDMDKKRHIRQAEEALAEIDKVIGGYFMKPVKVNTMATIIRGSCKGLTGKVIAFDSIEDEVTIGIDVYTNAIVDSESIKQE